MAKATKTTEKTTAAKAPKGADKAPLSNATMAFDAKANKARTLAERNARAAGKEAPKTTRHTVLPGQSVRMGNVRYGEGEAIDLGPADAERLVAKMKVTAGEGGAEKVAAANTAKADQAARDAEAAETQRIADEEAAKARAAEEAAKGNLSGAENR